MNMKTNSSLNKTNIKSFNLSILNTSTNINKMNKDNRINLNKSDLRLKLNYLYPSNEISEFTISNIKNDILNIKNKIKILNKEDFFNENESSFMNMILPKNYFVNMKIKINEKKGKANQNNEVEYCSYESQGMLYNINEEIVKKLNFNISSNYKDYISYTSTSKKSNFMNSHIKTNLTINEKEVEENDTYQQNTNYITKEHQFKLNNNNISKRNSLNYNKYIQSNIDSVSSIEENQNLNTISYNNKGSKSKNTLLILKNDKIKSRNKENPQINDCFAERKSKHITFLPKLTIKHNELPQVNSQTISKSSFNNNIKNFIVDENLSNIYKFKESNGDLEFLDFKAKIKESHAEYNNQDFINKEIEMEERLMRLNQELKYLLNKYSSLSDGLEKVNKRLCELKLEKDVTVLGIRKEKEILENDQDSIGNLISFSISRNKLKLQTNKSLRSKNGENENEKHYIKTEKKRLLSKLAEKEVFISKEIKISQYVKDSLMRDIISVEGNIKILKNDIVQQKEMLSIHYHNLLKLGKDTRNIGLTWIMLAIWKLGVDIYLSCMPDFLDNQLIKYFFLRAHKEIELYKVDVLLSDLKELVRIYRGKEYRKQKQIHKKEYQKEEISKSLLLYRSTNNVNKLREYIDNQIFDNKEDYKQDLSLQKNMVLKVINLKSIHIRKTIKNNKINIRKTDNLDFHIPSEIYSNKTTTEKITYTEINKFYKENTHIKLDKDSIVLIGFIEELEKIGRDLKLDLKIMKKREIERVSEEVIQLKYNKGYDIDIETILSCISGEFEMLEEIKHFITYKNNYLNKLKSFHLNL